MAPTRTSPPTASTLRATSMATTNDPRSTEERRMSRQVIHTERAPQAIGTYSQAVRAGDTVYLSGQVPFDPATMQLVSGDFEVQARRVFENLKAVAEAAGGSL